VARSEVEGLLRGLAPQVLGALVRRYGHFDLAEDAVQEALLAATSQWPTQGVPDSPRAWLIAVAARRLTDLLRSEQARRRREDQVARWMLPEHHRAPAADQASPESDDTPVVLFLCCHPALSAAAQIALTLRAVGGLSTAEIARAFLVPEATMTRRISRAKQTLAASTRPFAMPAAADRDARLAAVLHVLYLSFNEGYAATAGPDLQRSDLATEAIRLVRVPPRHGPDG
jgi:RNA polymerase sigma factor (sigma-70 family)